MNVKKIKTTITPVQDQTKKYLKCKALLVRTSKAVRQWEKKFFHFNVASIATRREYKVA